MLHRSWSEAEKEAEEDDEGRRRIYHPQKANMQTRGIGPMSNEQKSLQDHCWAFMSVRSGIRIWGEVVGVVWSADAGGCL